jgi:hypothetical protein
MPNRNGFIPDPRPECSSDARSVPCFDLARLFDHEYNCAGNRVLSIERDAFNVSCRGDCSRREYKRFTTKLRKNPGKGAWTYVIWPESVKFFGSFICWPAPQSLASTRPKSPAQRYHRCRQTQNCHCEKHLRLGRHLSQKLNYLTQHRRLKAIRQSCQHGRLGRGPARVLQLSV